MKTKTSFIFTICALAAVAASAQTMAQKSAAAKLPVTLNCVRASSGGAKNITWQTSYGSESREIARTLTYDCAVRWNGRAPTNALLEVWFVGIPATGGKDMILDNKVFELTLNPASNCVTRVTSESIDHSKTDYVALGMKERDGAKLRGCVVQLIIADEVTRVYASLGHLKDAAWKNPFGSTETGALAAKD